ncbi:tRNA lysidine(34) synthetase TilS [Baekduia soli]|uniref:tRNA lysidine(34) synthetase TilS n=1 Tax=Baekduia soli TaxID=496014 RepID=UPI001651E2DA|nr:tRNA lysidine(34) synthetase TilS [Baekduia soli]
MARVAATGLLPAGGPLVVLVSGGRDSTCLLDLAVTLAGPGAVSALHVDYGLRGPASAADAEHCAALCARLGVGLRTERVRRPEGAAGNLHAWAREARYAAGARAAAQAGGPLATGHTATDQVETILYRLATSPGRRALLGMEARTGDLVRPLLAADVTRAETADWCRRRGLAWREDASNADPAFARSRVRETLLPALEAVDGRAVGSVLRTARLLREEAAVLDEVVEGALAGRDRLGVDELAALGPALGRLVVRRLAEDATGRSCPRAASRLADVLALGDGALDLGDGARAVVGDGVLRLERTPPLPPRRC